MSPSLFSQYFPVPGYMKMDGIGVDISESAVFFVRIASSEKGYELKDFGEYPIPDGAFLFGKVNDPTSITAALSKIKKEHSIKFANASLSESQTYLAEIEVPTVMKSELRGSIELQISEHIPLEPSQTVFDYQEAETPKKDSGTTAVLVSAAPKELAESYASLFTKAGITLLSLETDAQAVCRAVVSEKNPKTTLVVNVCCERTGVYIWNNGLVHFASDDEISWKDIMAKGEPPEERFAALVEELNKTLSYWHNFKEKSIIPREEISKILLCGEGANIPGLAGFLSSRIRIPAEPANVWTNIFSFDRYIPEMNFEDSLKYATAVGLAMRSIER